MNPNYFAEIPINYLNENTWLANHDFDLALLKLSHEQIIDNQTHFHTDNIPLSNDLRSLITITSNLASGENNLRHEIPTIPSSTVSPVKNLASYDQVAAATPGYAPRNQPNPIASKPNPPKPVPLGKPLFSYN